MLLEQARAVLTSLGGARPALFEPLREPHRAWPWYCDSLGHINNVKYLELAQVGRVAWLARAGLLTQILRQRYAFLVAGTSITYRREVPRMAAFVLETQLLHFDERFVCFGFTFLLGEAPGEKIAARGFVRAQLRGHEGAATPSQVLEQCGLAPPGHPPALPPDLNAWLHAQAVTLDTIRAHEGRQRA